VFSLIHLAVNTTWPIFAAERRAAAQCTPMSTDISCPHGAQQQTQMTGQKDGTDGQTDTQPLHRPVYYVGSGSKTITTTEAANKENKKVKFNKFSYRSVFCRRPRQSNERILAFLDRKNSVTSLRRLVLGAKQPVISHISSQPRSSLALQHQNTAICAMPCTLLTLTITNNEWSKNFNKSPHCPALVTPSWRHGVVVSGVRQ